MAEPHLHLVDALYRLNRSDSTGAAESWRRWRAATDLDALDPASFRLVPALAPNIPEWENSEKDRNIFLGICRQAWSRNQVHRKNLTEARTALLEHSLAPAAAMGPFTWAELYWKGGAVRSTGSVDLLIQPEFLEGSVATLRSLGWEPQGNQLPRGPEFLFGPPVILEDRRRGRIRLYARALANTDLALRPVKPPPSHVAETEGGILSVVPHEYALVAALDAHLEDGLDWRADALMILRSGPLDWESVAQLVAGRSAARQRLDQLRMEWKLDVPAVRQAGRIRTRSEASLRTALRIWRQSKNHFLRPSGKPLS